MYGILLAECMRGSPAVCRCICNVCLATVTADTGIFSKDVSMAVLYHAHARLHKPLLSLTVSRNSLYCSGYLGYMHVMKSCTELYQQRLEIMLICYIYVCIACCMTEYIERKLVSLYLI